MHYRHESIRAVDYIVEVLGNIGVRNIFGVDGANIEDLFDAVEHSVSVDGIIAKHEFSAATMADGVARVGAPLGVVAVTSGAGALNLVPGLGESYASGVPILALVGQPATHMSGTGAFQDGSGVNGAIDLHRLLSAVSRSCIRVDRAQDIASALADAVAAARLGGPAVLLLPKDVQQARIARPLSTPLYSPIKSLPSPIAVALLARYLAEGSPAITIIAGDGVARADARRELANLAEKLDARIAVAPDAKDVVDSLNPRLIGVSGIMGHPGVRNSLYASDIALVVGSRLPVTARGGLDDALASTSVISIGADPPYIPADHTSTDDLSRTITEILGALPSRPASTPALQSPGRLDMPAHSGPGLRYEHAIAILDSSIPDGSDIFVDAGNVGASAVHQLPVRPGGRFSVALGMGGMGYSFGAAIGSAFVRGQQHRTWVVAGDGAFYMHGMEIHTAVQHRLPITFVVFNNNAHAMCVVRGALYFPKPHDGNRFRAANIGAGMDSMFPELQAFDVTTAAEFETALSRIDGGPALISVLCSADEIPTFAPFSVEPTHRRETILEEQLT